MPPVLGLHIRKCAGKTLLHRIASHLDSLEFYQSTSEYATFQAGSPVSILLVERPDRLKFVFGHHVHEQMVRMLSTAPVVFTGLREPVERIRSEIRYLHMQEASRGAPLTPPEIAAEWSRNDVCRQIIASFPTLAGHEGTMADRAMRALSSFSFVYFEDTFEAASDALSRHLGVPEDRTNHNVSSPSPISFDVDPLVPGEDIELYERAREKFWRADFEDCMAPSPIVTDFFGSAPELPPLRDFVNRAIFHEMKGWGIVPEFMAAQSRHLAERAALLDTIVKLSGS